MCMLVQNSFLTACWFIPALIQFLHAQRRPQLVQLGNVHATWPTSFFSLLLHHVLVKPINASTSVHLSPHIKPHPKLNKLLCWRLLLKVCMHTTRSQSCGSLLRSSDTSLIRAWYEAAIGACYEAALVNAVFYAELAGSMHIGTCLFSGACTHWFNGRKFFLEQRERESGGKDQAFLPLTKNLASTSVPTSKVILFLLPIVPPFLLSPFRERWLGVAGQPSTLNGQPIHTRPCPEISKAYLYATTPHMFEGAYLDQQGVLICYNTPARFDSWNIEANLHVYFTIIHLCTSTL
jgi:hypothetical protein